MSNPTPIRGDQAALSSTGAVDVPTCQTELLNAVLQALSVGVTVETREGRCLIANPAAVAIGGSTNGSDVETHVQTIEVRSESFRVKTFIDVSDHQRIATELFDRAYLDDLTGLPNRRLVEQSAEDLIASHSQNLSFAMAFIDIDNFKQINDFYSHAAGDTLLRKIADRLSATLRDGDMLARVGGDEFVMLITPVGDDAALSAYIDGLCERIKQPLFIDGHEIFASASIGVSVYPRHGDTYDRLRRNADSAMYRAKSGPKGGALLFNETMSHAATGRMALEQRFRLAIRDLRFCCAYQPKVDLHTREVVGLEVLLRWRDEEGSIRPPGEFVELAIELGLINDITHLVLAQTVEALPEIDEVFGPNTSISINIAAKQAEDLTFMTAFMAALAATGCAERFMLELTEEAFFAKSRFETSVLPKLRAIGVRVSIDDFGVGYSSLAALADITADELKIDRSFITDIHTRPRSQSILRAIESLGQALGMSIVAEGVETIDELDWLGKHTSIRYAQGYYFSKAISLTQLQDGRFGHANRPRLVGRHAAPLRLMQVR